MDFNAVLFLISGVVVGIVAAFSGLGGGIIVVPLLLFMGFSAQKAVGTSFLAIFIIAVSALFAHHKFANIDLRTGLLIGVGGIVGAQIGAYLVEHISTDIFKKIFALLLLGMAAYVFFKKES